MASRQSESSEQANHFRFLDLPAKIRLEIYSMCVYRNKTFRIGYTSLPIGDKIKKIAFSRTRRSSTVRRGQEVRCIEASKMMTLNKQIHDEYAKIFLERNWIVVNSYCLTRMKNMLAKSGHVLSNVHATIDSLFSKNLVAKAESAIQRALSIGIKRLRIHVLKFMDSPRRYHDEYGVYDWGRKDLAYTKTVRCEADGNTGTTTRSFKVELRVPRFFDSINGATTDMSHLLSKRLAEAGWQAI